MTTILITSYGTGHRDEPRAANPVLVDAGVLDTVPTDLIPGTGLASSARSHVLTSPGIEVKVSEPALLEIWRRVIDNRQDRVDVHVASFSGRHRSVAVAEELASRLRTFQAPHVYVRVTHRHIDRPILRNGRER